MKSLSIREIAKLAGCSVSTVSNVLNEREGFFSEDTRKRVMQVVRENNYVSNSAGRTLRKGSTETVGVVFYPKNTDIFGSEFYINILRSVQSYLAKNNYEMLLSEYTADMFSAGLPPQCVLRGKVDGIIVLGGFPLDAVEAIKSHDVPCVFLDFFTENADCITSNGRVAVKDIVRKLVLQGHTHIEYFAYGLNTYSCSVRVAGFIDGIKEAGLDENLCKVYDKLEDTQSAIELLDRILETERIPSAIIGCNDFLASTLMSHVLDKKLRVPEDIAFFGYDDISLSRTSRPTLSTVHVDINQMGEFAGQMLLDRIENPSADFSVKMLEPKIIERESSQGFKGMLMA